MAKHNWGKYRNNFFAATIMLVMSAAVPSSAQDLDVDADVVKADVVEKERSVDAPDIIITNKEECESEGGSIVKRKGGEFCLVPLRPEDYQSEFYDGTQRGIIICPGDKINDDLFCLYPITAEPQDGDAGNADKADDSAIDIEDSPIDAEDSVIDDDGDK